LPFKKTLYLNLTLDETIGTKHLIHYHNPWKGYQSNFKFSSPTEHRHTYGSVYRKISPFPYYYRLFHLTNITAIMALV